MGQGLLVGLGLLVVYRLQVGQGLMVCVGLLMVEEIPVVQDLLGSDQTGPNGAREECLHTLSDTMTTPTSGSRTK